MNSNPASGTRFDLIVIGSGPAGQKAAVQAAKLGKSVLLVEKHSALGGGCVHWGTLPSKSFRESVYRWSLGSKGTLGQEMGDHAALKGPTKLPDFKRLLKRRDRVVSSEEKILENVFDRNHIQVMHGEASFLSEREVVVRSGKKSEARYSADVFVIAVGSRPVAPKHITVDGVGVLDSDSVLGLKKVPRSMIVLGAGIIGCEYASMFSTAGTRVTLVDKREAVLASVDREIVAALLERFKAQKMQIVLGAEAEGVEPKGKKVRVKLGSKKKLEADVVLVAQGRVGNVEGLGLERVGISASDRGLISVNPHFQTSKPHIYAVGDVVGSPALASTSMEQGRIAAAHAFGAQDQAMSKNFPYGIYTIPEISMVGPTEEEIKAKGIDYIVGRAFYREVARGQIVGDRWGLLKIIAEKKTLKILGTHVIGDNAAELVHIGQAVMAFGGDLRYFICNVFNYPTLAEAYKTAAFDAFNRSGAPISVLRGQIPGCST